jgi:hypothetical protein
VYQARPLLAGAQPEESMNHPLMVGGEIPLVPAEAAVFDWSSSV